MTLQTEQAELPATPVSVLILGLSREFLDATHGDVSGQPGLKVRAVQEGVEYLEFINPMEVPQVLILSKSKRSDDFRILGQFAHRYPLVRVVLSAPYKDADMMVQALRMGVKEFLFEPVREGEVAAIVRRLATSEAEPRKPLPDRTGRVLAFMPCKGGAGATFIATNLAQVLASKFGKRVFVLDLNLQFGDAYLFLMDRAPQTTLGEVCNSFVRFDGRFLESSAAHTASGVWLLSAPEKPADAELVKPEHIETIVQVARGQFDFVILDVGRSLDAVSLKALDLADQIFPVLQMTLPSMRDAQRVQAIFKSLDYNESKVRWIFNRFGGQGDLALRDATQVINTPFWTVPNDRANAIDSVNQGVPVQALAPSSPSAKSLVGMARALLSEDEQKHEKAHEKKRWFSFH